MADLVDMLAAGLTYRELDYWTRNGYLRAQEAAPGSGNNRTWPDGEVGVARRMAILRHAGIPFPAAEQVARGRVEIAPGVYVLLDITQHTDQPPPVEDTGWWCGACSAPVALRQGCAACGAHIATSTPRKVPA